MEFLERIKTNHEKHKIILENYDNNQNLKILRDNYANYENL